MNRCLKWLFVLAGGLSASAAFSASMINTAYRISGDHNAAPLRAYDTGAKLILQFNDKNALPVVTTASGRGVTYEINGQYIALPIADKYILSLAGRQAIVEAVKKQEIAPPTISDLKTNIFFGKAVPASLTTVATAPVPHAVAIKKLDVSGDFLVVDPPRQAPQRAMPAYLDVAPSLSLSDRNGLKGQEIKKLVADGSLSGYRFAKQVADHIEASGMARPAIEMNGAPKGRIRLG